MNAINSLPINAPVAPTQRPHAEAASEQDSQSASFENLLDEKSAPAGEQAACASKAPRPDEPAEVADETNVPDNADFSTLLAVFPLQPDAIAPTPSSEAAFGMGAGAAVADTFFASGYALQTTPSSEEVRKQSNGALVAPDANAKSTFGTEFTQPASVGTAAPRPGAAPPVESFGEAAPAPEPAAKISETAVVVSGAHARREVRGTDVAMQERVMPDPLQSSAPEPKTAALAAATSARDLVAGPVAPQAEIRVPGTAWQQNSGGDRREEMPGSQPPPGDAPAPISTVASSFAAPAASADESAAITRTQTEAIVHRTMDAAERLRVTGGERVEVQIKLDAGPALTVRLQLIHGEVKPIFLTDSHELRQALEQNWSQFSERGADRTVRVTTPVFESPNAQSGMNDLNQQQREGRQRAFAEAQEAAFAANDPTGRILPRRANAPMPAAASATGVQLYA